MITSIERIGSETQHDGWFLINKHLNVQYIFEDDNTITINMNFDDSILTEQEANELAQEVLNDSYEFAKTGKLKDIGSAK